MIGLLGTAILVTAMIGVFRFEAAQAGGGWDVTFHTTTVEGPSVSERTAEGETSLVELDLPLEVARNATSIVFQLSWDDDLPESAPDTFELRVTAPNGANYTARAEQDGSIELPVHNLAVVPPLVRQGGATEQAAAQAAAARYTTTAAVGVWRVAVVMVEAGDQGIVGDLTVAQDNGNDWTLSTTLTTYAAQVARA